MFSIRRFDKSAMSFVAAVNRSAFNAPAKSPSRMAAFTEGRSGVSTANSAGNWKSSSLIISKSANSSGVSSDRAFATLSPAT